MATTPNSVISPQTPRIGVVQLSTLDTPGTAKVVYTGSANGSKINAIWATNSNSTAHVLTTIFTRSATNYGGTANTIPISASFAAGVPAVDVLSGWGGLPRDAEGNPYLFLQSTLDTISVYYASTFATGTFLGIAVQGADF